VRFEIPRAAAIHGFALWWEATLVEGITVSTSPFAPLTHWEQVFVPVFEPFDCRAGDVLRLSIETDSSGGQGAWVRWQTTHQREGKTLGEQSLDSRRGYF
jgi:protein arginine N-methyltransferase 1